MLCIPVWRPLPLIFHLKKNLSDIITLSSDSESSEEEDDDSDNAVMVSSDEEDELGDPEDVNNAGAHIDDSLNLPDEHGRVKVNVGHPAEDPDIFLAPQIAQAIKPHQVSKPVLG